jgi:hypothetical protein
MRQEQPIPYLSSCTVDKIQAMLDVISRRIKMARPSAGGTSRKKTWRGSLYIIHLRQSGMAGEINSANKGALAAARVAIELARRRIKSMCSRTGQDQNDGPGIRRCRRSTERKRGNHPLGTGTPDDVAGSGISPDPQNVWITGQIWL